MPEEVQRSPGNRGSIALLRSRTAGADQVIAHFAARQAGRVSRRQLLAAGVPAGAIDRRIASGSLLLEQPGVYAVAFAAAGDRERWAAALLQAGPGALLSHLAAAAALKIRLPAPPVVDVTTIRRLRSHAGVRFHRRDIDPDDRWEVDGFPVTSPPQTVFDLAAMLGDRSLLKVVNEAFVQRLVVLADLHLILARNARRRGSSSFRRVLVAIDPEGRDVRSPLEARLNSFLRARRFPPWESNAPVEVGGQTYVPDVLWRRQRVVVEADGRDPHLAPVTFASDRRRDRRLRVEGWQPVRVTSLDLDDRPDELDADLRGLLALTARQ